MLVTVPRMRKVSPSLPAATWAIVESGASTSPGPAWITVKRCCLPPTFTTRLTERSLLPVFGSAAKTMCSTSAPPEVGETVSHSGIAEVSKDQLAVAKADIGFLRLELGDGRYHLLLRAAGGERRTGEDGKNVISEFHIVTRLQVS